MTVKLDDLLEGLEREGRARPRRARATDPDPRPEASPDAQPGASDWRRVRDLASGALRLGGLLGPLLAALIVAAGGTGVALRAVRRWLRRGSR